MNEALQASIDEWEYIISPDDRPSRVLFIEPDKEQGYLKGYVSPEADGFVGELSGPPTIQLQWHPLAFPIASPWFSQREVWFLDWFCRNFQTAIQSAIEATTADPDMVYGVRLVENDPLAQVMFYQGKLWDHSFDVVFLK